ncbi:CaiB/BaiF CoA transferase family protein [Ideonella alba]|uniref:CoA transferase n=1 Tax=Ideonella alba TaxID=2824118 RepID=A0A940Y9Z1_9BURK|nr:CaiB/BaiF CoA-transferase family protein [Ideonella alba]MBQ0932677.1 CoA transferase [Ideonella alba]
MNTPLAPVLQGLTIVEFEGLGPGPLAGRWLAQHGATVIALVRPGPAAVADQLGGSGPSPLREGKRIEPVNLKTPEGLARARDLIASADALIEGNRPGVMERLGLGPADCAALNPRLVYGRMTGWGQSGPLAAAAGHDMNYIALTGLMGLAARPGQLPQVPPTVLGDAAGALGLAFGITAGVLAARTTGQGRVVDAAITDVVAMLGGLVHWIHGGGQIAAGAPSPFHDSPFYDAYACADGGVVTLGALEPPFYALLLSRLGLGDVDPAAQYDVSTWPALKARFTALFASQPRAHWCALLEGTDVCFAPVLGLEEALDHPHHQARGTFTRDAQGRISAAAAPRFAPLAPAASSPST